MTVTAIKMPAASPSLTPGFLTSGMAGDERLLCGERGSRVGGGGARVSCDERKRSEVLVRLSLLMWNCSLYG